MTEEQGNLMLDQLAAHQATLDALLTAQSQIVFLVQVCAVALSILIGFALWQITVAAKNERHLW